MYEKEDGIICRKSKWSRALGAQKINITVAQCGSLLVLVTFRKLHLACTRTCKDKLLTTKHFVLWILHQSKQVQASVYAISMKDNASDTIDNCHLNVHLDLFIKIKLPPYSGKQDVNDFS